MNCCYFGTDGIRGKVGNIPITTDFMLQLGYASGKILTNSHIKTTNTRPTVLIGKDTRISGYMLEAALEAGLLSAGVDVILAGSVPTPGVAYLTRALHLSAGIVISASHNPYYDNGVKFFSADGKKLPKDTEIEIEAWLEKPVAYILPDSLGKVKRLDDAALRYIEFCKNMFSSTLDLRGIKLVVDCANGAAYNIAPHIFHDLGAEVISIGVMPNGFNINDKVGTNEPDALVCSVQNNNADLGIALDGDADRLKIADATGRLYNGDELLYVLVKDRIATNGKVDGAVGTVMTNLAIEIALKRDGVQFVRTSVGDRYVLEQLYERGWELGAEASGHILSLDRHSTGDGIISALLVLAALRRNGCTLAKILDGISLLPQKLINIQINPESNWQDAKLIRRAIDKAERALDGSGRILIRASGTEPVLRIMVEAEHTSDANKYAKEIASAISLEMGIGKGK
ncbi:MAG: phosphoglucosamine mutase [Burkholderia sp.]|nr:phosphoglucosamine mutase [Burkholderia sp.]